MELRDALAFVLVSHAAVASALIGVFRDTWPLLFCGAAFPLTVALLASAE